MKVAEPISTAGADSALAKPYVVQNWVEGSAQARRIVRDPSLPSYGPALARMLAELQDNKKLEEARRGDAKDWLKSLDRNALLQWSLNWVTPLAFAHEQIVSPQTLAFCGKWLGMVCSQGDSLFDDPAARGLIRAREIRLKGGRSRFTNPRALDQWRGAAGLFRLNYRWPTVTQFTSDLQHGLGD